MGQYIEGNFPEASEYINVTQQAELRKLFYEDEYQNRIYKSLFNEHQLSLPLFNIYPIEAFYFILSFFRICYLRNNFN